MVNQHKVKEKKFKIGDSVTVTRIDRTCTDFPRISCMVVAVQGKVQKAYRLRCEHGVINNVYPASKLEEYTGELSFTVDGWDKESRISLREAASSQSAWNHFIANSCHCTRGCTSKRCRCMRNGISCSTHCHGNKPCSNKKDCQFKESNFILHSYTYVCIIANVKLNCRR